MNKYCPVCKTTLSGMDCDSCGTAFAGADLFAGTASYNEWQRMIKARIDALKPRSLEELTDALHISRGCAAVFDKRNKAVYLFFADGRIKTVHNIISCSLGDTHRVFVLEDGTVLAEGENRYGQCAVSGLENIACACAGDVSTYAVDRYGKVFTAGSIDANILHHLRNSDRIRCVTAGLYNCVLLSVSGQVFLYGGFNAPAPLRGGAAPWENVVLVRSCADAVLAVCSDRRVYYAGMDDGRKEAAEWEDIIDAAVDAHCAVGLTSDGTVRIAYKSRNTRRFPELEGITDAAAISGSRSGIAVVLRSGELIIAGNILRPDEIRNAYYRTEEARRVFIG